MKKPTKSQQRAPTPRHVVDAQVARELLAQRHPEIEETAGDEREARLWWLIQDRIFGPDEGAQPNRQHPAVLRSLRLAELWQHIVTFPEDTAAQTEREKIMETLTEEALAQLANEEEAIRAGKRTSWWEP
jgi:hypothetical protein